MNNPALYTTSEIQASGDTGLPTEMEVLQEGKWVKLPGRPDFEITASDIAEYASNFNAGIRPGVAINVEHDKDISIGKRAAGWIKGVVAKPNAKGKMALFAEPDFNQLGTGLVKDKQYRFVSAEFVPRSLGGQPDAEGKGILSNVLKKVSLTNEPLFKDLPAITASESTGESTSGLTLQISPSIIKSNEGAKSVNLDAIRGKNASEISAEEKTFLTEHKGELSAAEQAKFGLADRPTTEVKAGEGEVVIKASELADLKEKAAKADGLDGRIAELEKAANLGVKASEELATTKAQTVVDTHIKRGAIKSDQRDFWTERLVKASDEDRTAFEGALTALPDNQLLGAAKGDNKPGDKGGGAIKTLNNKAEEIMKASEGKIDYTRALLQARAENQVLASEADAEAANGEVA